MIASRLKRWRSGGLSVFYRPELEGGGTRLAGPFLDFIGMLYPRRLFDSAFEWCSGPGFIGFSLLAAGVCRRLCLADVNPSAVACARRTARHNGLEGRTACYCGDNLAALPAGERFDLVVANPPNFCRLNPRHPWYARMKDDPRPNDRDWRSHRRFYAGIGRHLLGRAVVMVSEVDPLRRAVHPDPSGPAYDLRPRAPLDDFKKMIAAGGLDYLDTFPYLRAGGCEFCMVVSTKGRRA